MAMPTGGPEFMNPFRDTVKLYRKSKWFGTLPLPAKKKFPPPTGFTGHTAPWPSGEDIKGWINDPKHKRANICLRLGGVDSDHEVIGIDVDHYVSGGKEKRGGTQLEHLENAHGKLPDTWISSARTDGVSGIRYFRVPRGLAFRGQVDKDIECIQKGHRFAVVWPSIHPDGGTYWWFPPGVALRMNSQDQWNGEVPDATMLPLLPDKWIDYLTQGRMTAGDVEIDMDSSVNVIYKWADETLPEGSTLCARMREKMDKHIELIKTEATSHDKIRNAHMNIFHLAEEGHSGWVEACNQIEQVFVDVCIARDKRGLDELRGEIFRSRSRGLRRVKASVDAKIAMGAQGVPDQDVQCAVPTGNVLSVVANSTTANGATTANTGSADPPDEGLLDIPRGALSPTPDYEQSDDGNALHFKDMFSSQEVGPAVRFIQGYGWIVWHNGDGGQRQPHWERDQHGDGIMRRMWQEVKRRQLDYAETGLHADYTNLLRQYNSQNNAPGQTRGGITQADVREAKGAWTQYLKFANSSGNNRQANAAIEAVKSFDAVRKSLEELDSTATSLAVSNGVVELTPEGATLRPAHASDYITMNTGTPWLADEQISTVGKKLWSDYLEKFLPDEEYRRDVQIALGHCVLGGNPHKKLFVLQGAANTGKSVMISMVNAVLGDYAATVNKSLFQYHKLNPVLALALPKRVVSIIELGRDSKNALTIDQIKTATGNDTVQAELKGANETVERVPFFVPIIVTNTVPNIEGADKALRERLHVISFDVVEEYPDDTIAARMRHESKTAVLAWLIDGYNEYCRIGRKIPENEAMKAAKEEFSSEFDDTSKFVQDCLVKHEHMGNLAKRWQDAPEWCALPAHVFSRYERWCIEESISGKDRLSQPALSRRLKELGFVSKQIRPEKMKPNRYWLGMKIKGGSTAVPTLDKINQTLGKD